MYFINKTEMGISLTSLAFCVHLFMPQVWTWLEDADTQILQGEKHVPYKIMWSFLYPKLVPNIRALESAAPAVTTFLF